MRYVYIALCVLGLVSVDACKVVSQSDLNGSGVTPGAAAATDAGDAALLRDGGTTLCRRDAGSYPKLPELGLVQGQPCVHNRQCEQGTYCDTDAFVCAPGSAGLGRNGVAPCTNGNACTSGLCVQDATNAYTCSDACDCGQDCGGKLPKCVFYEPFGIGMCSKP